MDDNRIKEDMWAAFELFKKLTENIENIYDDENREQRKKTIDEVSSLCGNARFLVSVLDMFEEDKYKNEIIDYLNAIRERIDPLSVQFPGLNHLMVRSKFDSLLEGLKLCFRCEYERYKYYKESNIKNDSENQLDIIWHDVLSESKNDKRFKYSIRGAIERAFRLFQKQIIDNYDTLARNASTETKSILDICRKVYNQHEKTLGTWHRRLKNMRTVLSAYMNNCPGTYGHLLWIILYVDELNVDVFKYDDEFAPEAFSSLEVLFEEQLEQFVSDSFSYKYDVKKILLYNPTRAVALGPSPLRHRSFASEEHRRVLKIIYRDDELRKNFIYKNGGDYGNRCFSILTDFRNDHYFAVSGYDYSMYHHLIRVFLSNKKTRNYSPIPVSDFEKALYGWGIKPINYKELTKNNTELKRINKKIVKPPHYKRMFSCAERRLIDTYDSKPNKDDYFVIEQKKPCYMCKRILDNHGTKNIYFEDYIMNNESQIQNELDTFADSL